MMKRYERKFSEARSKGWFISTAGSLDLTTGEWSQGGNWVDDQVPFTIVIGQDALGEVKVISGAPGSYSKRGNKEDLNDSRTGRPMKPITIIDVIDINSLKDLEKVKRIVKKSKVAFSVFQ